MSDLFLTHYNSDLEIIVASDASSYGVGACILHKMTDRALKPIAHASSALLPAEKNYLQIEKVVSGLYSQFQSSTAIFTIDTSLDKQTTNHYSRFLFHKRSFYAYSQQTAEIRYNPVRLQLQNGTYHRKNSDMLTDCQN